MQKRLEKRTIVITRAEGQSSEVKESLKELGAKVLDLPALVIGPPSEWGPVDEALGEIESFHWVIFSSANGVQAIEQRLNLINKSLRHKPTTLKLAAVGRKTAQCLERLGAKVDFVPPNFISESLIEHFPTSAIGLKILLPRVESGGRALLTKAFTKAGAKVIEIAAYESQCPLKMPISTIQAIEKEKVDAIVFCSGKTVTNTATLLSNNVGTNWLQKLNNVKVISIGPQTSKSCERFFKSVDKEANPHNIDGLINSCIELLGHRV